MIVLPPPPSPARPPPSPQLYNRTADAGENKNIFVEANVTAGGNALIAELSAALHEQFPGLDEVTSPGN